MDIVRLDQSSKADWDLFCLNHDEAWFYHTTKYTDYCVSYGAQKFGTTDLSFFVQDGKKIVAICPLLLEKKSDRDGIPYTEFSTAGSGGYGITPALANDMETERHERILKCIYEEVDTLAAQHNVSCASFRMNPLSLNRLQFNWLLKFGFFDSSVNTQVLDLTYPIDQLWSALRKGHKYDTRRGEKFYDIRIFDRTNPDRDAFELYRLLHHKAAGRVTRPIETFEMMYAWLCAGEGVVFGVYKDDHPVGFTYVNTFKRAACYSSASDDPDFQTDVPISHVIQWSVIRWLKEHGYERYEMGIQQFGPLFSDIPSPKDLSISFFKRGFGGRTVPLFRGRKYYGRDFMKSDLEANCTQLLAVCSGLR